MTALRFPWLLTQERIDLLANELYALQDVTNRLIPGCERGERVFCFLSDLRAQAIASGGEDPFPEMPFSPRFADTPVPAWPDVQLSSAEEDGKV